MDVRSKSGDKHPTFGGADNFFDVGGYILFTLAVSGALCVSAVRNQQHRALVANVGQALELAEFAVCGKGVQLEISGMHDIAHRSANNHAGVVRDGVGHADQIYREMLANLHSSVGFYRSEVQVAVSEAKFVKFLSYQSQREARTVNRHFGQTRHNVRHGPDVVLVAVGQHPTLDECGVLLQILDAGNDKVHAHHGGIREGEAAVYQQNLVFIAVSEHILADFAHTAQRNYFYIVLCRVLCHLTPRARTHPF